LVNLKHVLSLNDTRRQKFKATFPIMRTYASLVDPVPVDLRARPAVERRDAARRIARGIMKFVVNSADPTSNRRRAATPGISAGGTLHAEVRAFLITYYGEGG
jgi:hypothetical protein